MKDAAFAKCSGLSDVTVHALVPPVIESFHYYPFEGCYDKATLLVPAEALAYYQENPFWSRFTHIETFDPEGHQAQELRRHFGQGTQRTPPASLRLLGQQAFNENPEGVASSQPRASERSERHPGLGAKGYDSPPEGAKARTEAFKFADSILSVAAFAPSGGES